MRHASRAQVTYMDFFASCHITLMTYHCVWGTILGYRVQKGINLKYTVSPNSLIMSMMENKSLQQRVRAIFSASIVESAVSVCYLDTHTTGHSHTVIKKPFLLLLLWDFLSSHDHKVLQSHHPEKHLFSNWNLV